jgi:hypothetical protein
MNNKNTMKLFNDFPDLYKGRNLPPTENLMCFGFEVQDGWFNLIYELSSKLSKIDPNCRSMQVKEKFGGLRFYVNGESKEGSEIIFDYQDRSFHICEFCGDNKTAKPRGGRWIKTLCFKCNLKREINRFIYDKKWEIEYNFIKLKKIFRNKLNS